ncbi:MAG: glycogen debranching N-terminal domain-containing protein, partial [Polyangia bacterium]
MSVMLHHGTCFVISDERGDLGEGQQGFYFEDVRCLDRFRLLLGGAPTVPLSVTRRDAQRCTFWASNAESESLAAFKLVIRRERTLGDCLAERITIESFAEEPVELELQIELGADFADIFAVKQQVLAGHPGAEAPSGPEPERDGGRVSLSCQLHHTRFCTEAGFDPAPDSGGKGVGYRVRVARGQPWSLALEIVSRIEHPNSARSTRSLATHKHDERRRELQSCGCSVESDHPVLAKAFSHAAADMVALRLNAEENIEGELAIAAGIPWYMALFGRDSLIASYQALLHDPELARGTLIALAHLQGRKVDPASEEQPGRILHEYRKHLRASARRNIPKFPYYGTIDATPLWLVTLSEYVNCTGDLALADRLWPSVLRALDWIEHYGDCDQDGLIEYKTPEGGFLANEGWKDSPDSVCFRDGTLARQPIALIEVQGYVADAYERVARLEELRKKGDPAKLRERAANLRRLIHERFRLADRDGFAEALDGDKRPVDSLTSNPGQLLWSRAVGDEDAAAIARDLFGEELFAGWGVRTLGTREGRYNPISYHNGSIWPHDNALIALGMQRTGHAAEAARVARGIVDAAERFVANRLPELFAGLPREETTFPVQYLGANVPQAWAAGCVIQLIST